ncbi:MAG: 3-phosphoshikimate 1-carboxyvinyltransferase [Prevotella sp.]|nr:3-phosphoshikimate 1-carboxyvinyltransferase [Prevotella sp.]
MTRYKIQATKHLDTTITLPPSKSISNRALIIHALSGGNSYPQNLSDCDDTDVIIKALQDMPYEIDIKAAGTAMRFMTAYLAVTEGEHVLTGTERMKHRPIEVLVNALRYLGADIEYVGEEGFPPLRIRGKTLDGGQIEVPGNISSQYISALLMIGPTLQNGLELKMTGNIISRPYIDLTLWTMREFGAKADWVSGDTVMVYPSSYKQREYLIENDWSAASYWYEMVALSRDENAIVHLNGLMDGSKQGDSVVRYIFSMLGVKTVFKSRKQNTPTTVTLKKSGRVVPRLDYDFTNSPDLAQTVVACCAALGVPFHFKGLSTLKIKETDRIKALCSEMRKVGMVLRVENDSELIWDGERCDVSLLPIDTYEDHRMALSFAPMSLRIDGIRINDPMVVTKSYPAYWNDLQKAGFTIDKEG